MRRRWSEGTDFQLCKMSESWRGLIIAMRVDLLSALHDALFRASTAESHSSLCCLDVTFMSFFFFFLMGNTILTSL